MGRGRSARLCLWLVLISSHPVLAQETAPDNASELSGADQEARALFMAAQVAFDEGRFESAVQYFLQAHQLSHRPELLYNIGNTYDRLQQPEQALQYFDRYLSERPNADNRLQVEARARLLRQSVEARRTSSAPTATTPASAPATTATVPTPEQTAQAHVAAETTSTPSAPPAATVADEESGSGWILWTGIGAAVVAATVVSVVIATSGSNSTQPPLVPHAGTRMVRL